MEKIKSKTENPNGLHKKYQVNKLIAIDVPEKVVYNNRKRIIPAHTKYKAVPCDLNAEYFVLRLDTGGSDINHIKACRIGIHAYADAIEATIPKLAKDLRDRYHLI